MNKMDACPPPVSIRRTCILVISIIIGIVSLTAAEQSTGTSRPSTAAEPSTGTSRPSTAAEPSTGTSRPSTAAEPSTGTSRPSTAAEPSTGTSRPSTAAEPSTGTSRPSTAAEPSTGTSRPSTAAEPSTGTSRPSTAAEPSTGTSRPSTAAEPSTGTSIASSSNLPTGVKTIRTQTTKVTTTNIGEIIPTTKVTTTNIREIIPTTKVTPTKVGDIIPTTKVTPTKVGEIIPTIKNTNSQSSDTASSSTAKVTSVSVGTSSQTTVVKPVIDVRNYPIPLKIKTSAKFTEDLRNTTSEKYKEYTNAFSSVLTKLYDEIPGFQEIIFKGFSAGSVICDYDALFDLGVTSKNAITSDVIKNIIYGKLKTAGHSKDLPGVVYESNITGTGGSRRLTDPCYEACPGHSKCTTTDTEEVIKCSCMDGFKGSVCIEPVTDTDTSLSSEDEIIIIVGVFGAIVSILIFIVCTIIMMYLCKRKKRKGSPKKFCDRDQPGKGHANPFKNSAGNDKKHTDPSEADRAGRSLGNNYEEKGHGNSVINSEENIYEEIQDKNVRKSRDMDLGYERPCTFEMVYSPSRSSHGRQDDRRGDYDTTQGRTRDFDEVDHHYKKFQDPYSRSGEHSIFPPTSPRRGDPRDSDRQMPNYGYTLPQIYESLRF